MSSLYDVSNFFRARLYYVTRPGTKNRLSGRNGPARLQTAARAAAAAIGPISRVPMWLGGSPGKAQDDKGGGPGLARSLPSLGLQGGAARRGAGFAVHDAGGCRRLLPAHAAARHLPAMSRGPPAPPCRSRAIAQRAAAMGAAACH